MIKNKLFLLLMAVGVFTFSGCEEFLNADLTDAVDAEAAYETIDDVELALAGAYGSFRSTGYYYNLELLTDDIKITSENLSGSGRFTHAWDYFSDNTFSGIWSNRYGVIYQVNDLLENIGNVSGGDEAQRARIIGEAKALRALALHDLVKVFAEPYTNGSGGMGVPVLTSNNSFGLPARNTIQEVYDAILADLTEADGTVTQTFGSSVTLNKVSVQAIMARVKLHMGRWSEAVEHADYAIANGPSLVTGSVANMANYYSDGQEGETIFRIFYTENDATLGTNFYNAQGDNAPYRITEDLIATYGAGDIRGSGATYSPIGGRDVITKYPGKAPDLEQYQNDLKMIRQAEMHLIKAEAYAQMSNSTSAFTALNVLQNARGGTVVSSGSAIDEVQVERRRELAYEGFRFCDLKRWGQSIVRGSDCSAGACTLAAGSHKFNLPIPQSELDANPNMQQNSGY